MTLGGSFLRPTEPGPSRTRSSARAMDPHRDKAIAAAVLQVLADVGFRRLTMDDVALSAGVSKATIYRRWSSKAELLASVIDVAGDDAILVPDSGSLRGDLVSLLQTLVDALVGTTGRATRAVLSAVLDDPALAEAYQRGPLARWAEAFGRVFERAVGRGEITPGEATSLGAEAGPAILILRWLFNGRPLGEDVVTGVVEEVMMPLLRKPGALGSLTSNTPEIF